MNQIRLHGPQNLVKKSFHFFIVIRREVRPHSGADDRDAVLLPPREASLRHAVRQIRAEDEDFKTLPA